MRITYKGDYALKAVLDLTIHYGSEPITISDMAKRIDAPIKFLEQVLLILKRGGFIESRRGKVGGYLLSRPPDKITLGEVIRCVDGPIEPIACVNRKYTKCNDVSRCVFKDIWCKVNQATSNIIDNVTFEDLVRQSESSQLSLSYSI
jgi:Rrf2 family cysteine metabolism transcriptional repressor